MRQAALAVAIAWLALPARAELVEVDLNAPGDKLVTRDTDTGLDWLDVPLTTNLSYDDIQGGAGGWSAAGWRYATQAEVCHLWSAHAGAPSCSFASPILFDPPTAAIALTTLLGATVESGTDLHDTRVDGYYDGAGPSPLNVGFASLEVLSGSGLYMWFTSASNNGASSSDAQPTRGSFLVRATPPEIPALPVDGVAALAAALALAARRALAR